MNKEEIRKELKSKRNKMDKKEVKEKSLIIQKELLKLIQTYNYNNYFIYNSYNNEVETSLIINHLLNNNKNVYLPKIVNEAMVTIKYTKSTILKKGTFNIYEPIGNEEDISNFICIVPLVGVDTKGNRIGQGKGFYDKFLKNKKCIKIGICYDFQLIESIHSDPYDVPLDLVITEKQIIYFN